MPVDKTELARDLAENPEYVELAKAELTKKKFTIRDEEGERSFLDNYKRDVIEKEIPNKIKEVHDAYDKDIKELFGMDRAQDEKSYDFLKRAAKTKLDGLTTEINSLTEQIKKGDPSGALTKKLEDAEALYRKTLQEKEDSISKLKGDYEGATKKSVLAEVYGRVRAKFKKELPAMFTQTEKYILDNTLAGAVLKDGVLYKGDGSGGIAKDNNFVEIKIEDELAVQFKDVIDERKAQGGAGSGGAGGGGERDPNTMKADEIQIPAELKSQDDLMTYLIRIGLKRGTPLFNEVWKNQASKLPLTSA